MTMKDGGYTAGPHLAHISAGELINTVLNLFYYSLPTRQQEPYSTAE